MQLLRLLLTLALAVLDAPKLPPRHSRTTSSRIKVYTTYTEDLRRTGSLSPFLMTVAITRTLPNYERAPLQWRRQPYGRTHR